jgi:hypothetical protein
MVEEGSADGARFVRADVAEERQHRPDARMPAQHFAGDILAELKAAAGEIALDQRTARIGAGVPKVQGAGPPVVGRPLAGFCGPARGWFVLAGQTLDRFAESAAIKSLDKGDDGATGAAAAAVENLFSDVDAEAIAAAASRARAAAIDRAPEPDPTARHFVFNAHGASALDQVAGDHGAAHDVSAPLPTHLMYS